MPTYNFMAQFVPKIEDGSKGGTIRAYRKYPVRVGQTMYLSTGSRFKPVRLKAVPCVEVWDIEITEKKITLKVVAKLFDVTILLDTTTELNAFARSDGFSDFKEMKKFWKGELPFRGFHARWIPLKEQVNVVY